MGPTGSRAEHWGHLLWRRWWNWKNWAWWGQSLGMQDHGPKPRVPGAGQKTLLHAFEIEREEWTSNKGIRLSHPHPCKTANHSGAKHREFKRHPAFPPKSVMQLVKFNTVNPQQTNNKNTQSGMWSEKDLYLNGLFSGKSHVEKYTFTLFAFKNSCWRVTCVWRHNSPELIPTWPTQPYFPITCFLMSRVFQFTSFLFKGSSNEFHTGMHIYVQKKTQSIRELFRILTR